MQKLFTNNNKAVSASAVLIGLVALLFVATPVSADQYGGQTPNTSITLNKQVLDPLSGNFVDNMGVGNTIFQTSDEVTFRLNITNNGNTSFGFVDIKDTLPNFLDFVSGPGSFNASSRQLTFRIENLTPGQTVTKDIKTKVVSQNQLPSDGGTFCVVNAASLATNDGRTASDTAQACLGKKVLGAKAPAKELPRTGYTEILLGAFFASAAGLGFVLRKAKY